MNSQGLPMPTGSVITKEEVRWVLEGLVAEPRRRFSEGQTGVEQAINRICSLQRPPGNLEEVALTVGCDYCGRTPGNRCRRGGVEVKAHPSRLAKALR